MARQESDREDLLREATALVERAELNVDGYSESIVVGFRRDSSFSIFFGAEPVYQFNTRLELRRSYYEGRLVKAEAGHLVALRRERSETEVALIRSSFTGEQTTNFMDTMQAHLRSTSRQLGAGNYQLIGQVPETTDVVARARDWLLQLPHTVPIADRPNVA